MPIPSSTALEITRQDGYLLSTDRTKLDLNIICEWISTDCYWAIGRPHDVIRGSIEHSLVFGVYARELSSGDVSSREEDSWKQVAFARVVTDYCIHLLIPSPIPCDFSCLSPLSLFSLSFTEIPSVLNE